MIATTRFSLCGARTPLYFSEGRNISSLQVVSRSYVRARPRARFWLDQAPRGEGLSLGLICRVDPGAAYDTRYKMLRHCVMAILCFAAAARPEFGQSAAANCELSGSVVDDNGTPVAGLHLTAYSSMIRNGQRTSGIAGLAATDDAGHYCMRQLLRSGAVFLRTAQWFDFKQPNALQHTLPSTWYPGVADFRLAKAVAPGSDARADFKLPSVGTFAIEGKTTGLAAFRRIDLRAETPEGIAVENGILDTESQPGMFTIQGITPGNWTFVVSAIGGAEILVARLQYEVNRDIHDAALAFAPDPHLNLNVNGKPFRASEKDDSGLALYRPQDYSQNTYSFGPFGVPPGAYKLMVFTGFQCIESFSSGDVQLSGGNLIITSRKYVQPISVRIGKHCATLTILLPQRETSPPTILMVPESLPFRPITISSAAVDLPYVYDAWPRTPGTYRVYAFKSLDGLEYENPAVLNRFSGQTVVLEAGKRAQIALDVVNNLP